MPTDDGLMGMFLPLTLVLVRPHVGFRIYDEQENYCDTQSSQHLKERQVRSMLLKHGLTRVIDISSLATGILPVQRLWQAQLQMADLLDLSWMLHDVHGNVVGAHRTGLE